MVSYEKLDILIKSNKGIITFKDCKDSNIHHEYLKKYVQKNKLEKVSRGVYITPNIWEDKMYIIQLQSKKIIYSHATALYLLGLTDREPLKLDVSVPMGYNITCLKNKGLITHSVKKELYEIGLIKVKNMYGNEVTIYNKERTICDLIKARNKIDVAILTEALKIYVKRKDKNINRLYEYAKIFRVRKIISQYMEVLL